MSFETQTTLILGRFNDNLPVATANVSWDYFGAPHGGTAPTESYAPPAIDANDPDSAIWQRPRILPVPRAVPMGIGATSPTYRRGRFTLDTFFARGYAPQAAIRLAETGADLFHRTRLSSLQFEDKEGPEFLVEAEFVNFKGIRVSIPFYILDPSSSYVEDGYVQ